MIGHQIGDVGVKHVDGELCNHCDGKRYYQRGVSDTTARLKAELEKEIGECSDEMCCLSAVKEAINRVMK